MLKKFLSHLTLNKPSTYSTIQMPIHLLLNKQLQPLLLVKVFPNHIVMFRLEVIHAKYQIVAQLTHLL